MTRVLHSCFAIVNTVNMAKELAFAKFVSFLLVSVAPNLSFLAPFYGNDQKFCHVIAPVWML